MKISENRCTILCILISQGPVNWAKGTIWDIEFKSLRSNFTYDQTLELSSSAPIKFVNCIARLVCRETHQYNTIGDKIIIISRMPLSIPISYHSSWYYCPYSVVVLITNTYFDKYVTSLKSLSFKSLNSLCLNIVRCINAFIIIIVVD